jgi:hypothetical protein
MVCQVNVNILLTCRPKSVFLSPKPRAAPFDLFSYGRVIARRIDNTPIAITLEYESTETTKAVIRVGRDKETSLAIKKQIRKTLNQ